MSGSNGRPLLCNLRDCLSSGSGAEPSNPGFPSGHPSLQDQVVNGKVHHCSDPSHRLLVSLMH